MSSKTPYRISEINTDNICYSDIKTNIKKTIIYLKYSDNNKLKNIIFQTPTLLNRCTPVCKNDIYEIDIPISGKSDSKITKFINLLNAIDNKIIKDAKNNTKWFGAFPNQKTMKYQRLIRDSPEYKDGLLRLKIIKTPDFETILQLNNTNNINVKDIPQDSWIKTIIEIYAIWINENGFGLFIRPILISFKPNQKISYDFKLIDESDDGECDDDIDFNNDTIQDNSNIFIKSESEITSSVLENPYDYDESTDTIDIKPDISSTTSE